MIKSAFIFIEQIFIHHNYLNCQCIINKLKGNNVSYIGPVESQKFPSLYISLAKYWEKEHGQKSDR